MRNKKKLLLAALLCTLLLTIMPMQTFAAQSIEPDTPCTLNIAYQYSDGTKLGGMTFDIFRIASVDSALNFTLTEQFKPYESSIDFTGIDLDGWYALAGTLENHVIADSLSPLARKTTDANGCFSLNNLETGLYLIVGGWGTIGGYTYSAIPGIVCLPSQNPASDTFAWTYELTVSPKVERKENPVMPTLLEYKVIVTWDDEGCSENRPEMVTINLLQNGIIYDTVVVTAEDNWEHVWSELPEFDEDGIAFNWSIIEEDVFGYTTTYDIKGDYITVVPNKCRTSDEGKNPDTDPEKEPEKKSETPKENLPQTGVLWWPIPVLLCLGIVFISIGTVLKRNSTKH